MVRQSRRRGDSCVGTTLSPWVPHGWWHLSLVPHSGCHIPRVRWGIWRWELGAEPVVKGMVQPELCCPAVCPPCRCLSVHQPSVCLSIIPVSVHQPGVFCPLSLCLSVIPVSVSPSPSWTPAL